MPEPEIIFAYQQSADRGYTAQAMGYAIFAQADTIDELKTSAQDALVCHFGEHTPLPQVRLLKGYLRNLGSANGEFTVPDDFNGSIAQGD